MFYPYPMLIRIVFNLMNWNTFNPSSHTIVMNSLSSYTSYLYIMVQRYKKILDRNCKKEENIIKVVTRVAQG